MEKCRMKPNTSPTHSRPLPGAHSGSKRWRPTTSNQVMQLTPVRCFLACPLAVLFPLCEWRYYRTGDFRLSTRAAEDGQSQMGPATSELCSLRAVDDLLRILDRGLVRRFVFPEDVDRLLRRGGGFFLVAKLRLNLRFLVVHEVGVWVLLQCLVDPLRRLVHVLVVVVVKGRGLISGARVERSPCANDCVELLAYLLDIVSGQLHRHARFIPKEIKRRGSAFHIS